MTTREIATMSRATDRWCDEPPVVFKPRQPLPTQPVERRATRRRPRPYVSENTAADWRSLFGLGRVQYRLNAVPPAYDAGDTRCHPYSRELAATDLPDYGRSETTPALIAAAEAHLIREQKIQTEKRNSACRLELSDIWTSTQINVQRRRRVYYDYSFIKCLKLFPSLEAEPDTAETRWAFNEARSMLRSKRRWLCWRPYRTTPPPEAEFVSTYRAMRIAYDRPNASV
jgi:hypothetical protein